jgi:tetratricopeptide (TPR) repeat protein
MAEKKHTGTSEEVIIERAKDFWAKYNKPVMIVSVVIILLAGGYFGYKNFILKPKESKASEDMFRAEEYYRNDSLNLALNGDGQYPGFLKIIDKYGGTKPGKLARFYAGVCYVKMGDNANAIKHLKKFSSRSKQIQARAYKLLGDAYADSEKYSDALDYYKKAAYHFEEDKASSSEALFLAAYLADKAMKDQKQAIELYKELLEKFPGTARVNDAEKYLAQLGVYNTEE